MPKSKAPYPAQFRQQMVELVQAGRKPRDLAKEFGCHADSINAWVSQHGEAKAGVGAGAGVMPLNAAERHELVELRRKYRQVQQERDILAKATAWFAHNGAPTSTTSTR
jgi:transposase